MTGVDQISVWVLVVLVYIALPLLLVGPNRVRHALAVRLERAGTWALPHLQAQDPDVDPVEMVTDAATDRRERLAADLRRLGGLLRDDAAMSATRQLANRIAYDWVRREAAELDHALLLVAPHPLPTVYATGPVVRETLDVGWRS